MNSALTPASREDSAVVSRIPLAVALALGEGTWDALLQEAGGDSPFAAWSWQSAWAATAPPQDLARTFALVLRGGEGAVEAILPLRQWRTAFHRLPVTALTWAVGDDGCPDHLDFPARPSAPLHAFVGPLLAERWQILQLTAVAERSPNVARLADALRTAGCVVQRHNRLVCPVLELPATWDAYLGSVSSQRRQTIRRKERALFRDHKVEVTIHDGASLATGWEQLVTLHRQRWPEGSEFSTPRQQALHRHLAQECANRGTLWLATVTLDGAPAAAWYGFSRGSTLSFYQGGIDPAWSKSSVGQVLHGLMIQRAIEKGMRRYDFLRGEESYKDDWTSSSRRCEEWTAFRPGWGGRLLRGVRRLAEVRAQRARSSRG